MVVGLLLVIAGALLSWLGFFFFRDNFSTHYPLKSLSAEAWRAGEIPWWNFHDSGGQPLAGNPNALTFYPDNLLYLVLPAHVAFNLHFLLHLAAAFFVMRALCAARGVSRGTANFAATVYVLSGVAISATAFTNLVTAVALIPLALLAAERRSWRLLGVAFGLMLLAAEPVTLIGAGLAIVIWSAASAFRADTKRDLLPWLSWAKAVLLAVLIAAPQLIAYAEISSEVERVAGFSARTVLNTSLAPTRVAEIFLWPFSGFLNDAGGDRQRLFSTLFLGLIAIPALVRRSRYVAIAAAMLFLALGRFNPLVAWLIESLPSIRVMRYPEKFALPLIVALVVLIAMYFERARLRVPWALVTLVPLVVVAAKTLPVDWFAPYDVLHVGATRRVHQTSTIAAGSVPARQEYRHRAAALEPLFGAVAGASYGIVRSPDNMHALLSRVVAERFASVPPALQERYLRIYGCAVPRALPFAMIVQRAVGARGLDEAVQRVEHPNFDEQTMAIAPAGLHGFASAPATIRSYRHDGQTIAIDVETRGPALLFVNQTFFEAWDARLGEEHLETMPLDVDRLGILVPSSGTITLRFGKWRGVTTAAWLLSSLLLATIVLVEVRDRRAREVQRAADEDRPLV